MSDREVERARSGDARRRWGKDEGGCWTAWCHLVDDPDRSVPDISTTITHTRLVDAARGHVRVGHGSCALRCCKGALYQAGLKGEYKTL